MSFKVICPHCQREGSSKKPPPDGAKVRCPGCGQKFVYQGSVAVASSVKPGPPGAAVVPEDSDTYGFVGDADLDLGTASSFSTPSTSIAPDASVPIPDWGDQVADD